METTIYSLSPQPHTNTINRPRNPKKSLPKTTPTRIPNEEVSFFNACGRPLRRHHVRHPLITERNHFVKVTTTTHAVVGVVVLVATGASVARVLLQLLPQSASRHVQIDSNSLKALTEGEKKNVIITILTIPISIVTTTTTSTVNIKIEQPQQQ